MLKRRQAFSLLAILFIAAAPAQAGHNFRHLGMVQAGFGSAACYPRMHGLASPGVRRTTERAEATVPLRRPGRPREAEFLALYLASSASDYMTGQTILLDGGLGL